MENKDSYAPSPRSEAIQRASQKQFESDTITKGIPRPVYFKFKLNDIRKVDDSSNTVDMDVSVYLRWIDTSIAGEAGQRLGFTGTPEQCNQLWRPIVEVSSSETYEELWARDTNWTVSDLTRGEIRYSQKYHAKVRCPHDFQMFPFDLRSVKFNVNDQLHDHTQLVFVAEQESNLTSEVEPQKYPLFQENAVEAPEWSLDCRYLVIVEQGQSKRARSHAVFQVILKRKFAYYIYKIWLISALLGMWSWITFFADPSNLSFRTSTSLTLFLSLVAFLFVANGSLPKVPYLTRMDKLLLFNFVHLFVVGIESFLVYLISDKGLQFYAMNNKDAAMLLDRLSIIMFPAAFLIFHGSIFVHAFMWRKFEGSRIFQQEEQLSVSAKWGFTGIQNDNASYVLVKQDSLN